MSEQVLFEPNARMSQIKSVVCEILELEENEVTETSLVKDEHNADSLRAIESLATLEKKFSVKIPQLEMANMVNLIGVYDVVKEAAGWQD